MEKKFKNQLAIKGPVSLKRAFIEELKNLGYSEEPSSVKEFYPNYPIQVNQYGGNGKYGIWSNEVHSGCNPIILTLPQDWDKALQYASEKEEVIPEYVECIQNDAGIKIGEIYKVSRKEQWGIGGDVYCLVGLSGQPYYCDHFKPSSLEEYTKQQNAPKFKVGDFYSHAGDLRHIHAIKNGKYKFSFQISNKQTGQSSNYIASVDNDKSYRKITDGEALQMLKAHYAKQGIVEGAKISVQNSCSYKVVGLELVKTTNKRNNWSGLDHGYSQLAIIVGEAGNYYTTPSIQGFAVLPKEVKVAGYEVGFEQNHPDYTPRIIKIGCQHYTKDALVTIRDLIIHGIQDGGRTEARFQHSSAGVVNVTVDELNEAIKLFDNA